ncbi:bifunctional nicotinamidase/pyrazinamidase [Chitinispirillales bacterium ANBcel5]|uniref:bifunctional nicotinamidase/pyrazinamidase n=1 Tax=Cellulosispirillum alkaliphilum TaxID=3039283 RepID=UPI002A4EA5A2|nr:bifunctional nicotinamidase/pyrazinamidase [Chitinispirillales bacterium ANBcel5]
MKRILVIADIQNDFCPGGALATKDGDKIIPNVNKLLNCDTIERAIAAQDWHPQDHISFASVHGLQPFQKKTVEYGEQMLWPDHCVRGTQGAQFHPQLDERNIHFVVRKAYHKNIDDYSVFFENDKKTATGAHALVDYIAGGEEFFLIVCGIATDYCVLYTALDAKQTLGYGRVAVAVDACAGITPDTTEDALKEMTEAGVELLSTQQVLQ